jgi:3-hydroxyisobutyrate dehydrogenase-like beta-hydroxyacid dehydrogenase
MATATMRLGFVGLGHMGGAMAARFLQARHQVYGETALRSLAAA